MSVINRFYTLAGSRTVIHKNIENRIAGNLLQGLIWPLCKVINKAGQ